MILQALDLSFDAHQAFSQRCVVTLTLKVKRESTQGAGLHSMPNGSIGYSLLFSNYLKF